jgi:N utilization substance protein A
MEAGALIESFSEFAKTKNIDRPTMLKVLEDVFRTMIRKKYEDDANFDVIINTDKGDLEIWMYREIVPDDYDDYEEYYDYKHILISDAKKIEPDFEIGEQYAQEIKMEDFGRRIVQTARQTLIQRIKDLEKDILFQKYKELVGEVIVGEVYQVLGREIVVQDVEKQELTLPKAEQIYKDRYKKGDQIRAVIHRVEMINGNPKIILSRISPVFIERLFEAEVPEVYEGVITIRKVVREPGERAKVAVESYDDRIDPVGACVGMKGSRIHSIVRELCNENIDVINYTDNTELFISRALSPAKISSIKVDEKRGRAAVFLKRDQVSLAIGKSGQNIKLASRLVDLEIDVFRDTEEETHDDDDVELTEFEDAIDGWIIEELQRIGLDTARSVLAVSREDLVRRTELEEETVDFVLDVLKKELES